jgi:2-isopropylmalate synthase
VALPEPTPHDATFKAVTELTGFKGKLTKYVVTAITGGTDAQGEVYVTIEEDGKTVRGSGTHTDVIVASALAFLAAINKIESYSKPKNLLEYL